MSADSLRRQERRHAYSAREAYALIESFVEGSDKVSSISKPYPVHIGPSSRGGVLQWGRPEGNMRRPMFDSQEDIVISERTHAALNEDPDVAPSCETAVPDAKQVPDPT